MKNYRWIMVVSAIFMLSAVSVSAQVVLGLRDNQYVSVGYTYRQSWSVKLEHSVFSQEFSTQYIRFMLGYKHCRNRIAIEATPYYGTLYHGDFYNVGVMFSGHWQMLRKWGIECTVNPHYDSGYDYKLCFSMGTNLHLYKAISVVFQYSTIPEYRMKEERVKFGFEFKVNELCVVPLLSIPMDSSGKNMRILCNLKYQFYF